MPQACPHCGASLPIVRDAFCSECRAPLSENPSDAFPIKESLARLRRSRREAECLTTVGRILVSVALSAAIVGPFGIVICLRHSLLRRATIRFCSSRCQFGSSLQRF